MLAVHHWLLPSLHVFTVRHRRAARRAVGALGLAGAPASWPDALGEAGRRGRPAASLPSGWLGVELVRSWQGLGGPWGLLGASQWQVAPALRLASVGGVWLLSFLVVAVNVAVAVLVVLRESRLPAAGRCSWPRPPRPRRPGCGRRARTPTAGPRIAVVQAGVVDGADSADRRFDREEQLTRRLAGQDVDLVVWGESSVGFDLADRPACAPADRGPLPRDRRRHPGQRGRPALRPARHLQEFGAGRCATGPPATATTRCGWSPSASTSRRARCSAGRPPSARRRARTAGGAPGRCVMDVGHGLRIGPMVCFETAFPDMSRHLAADGADGAGRPVVDIVVPAQLGPGAARLAGRAARRGDGPPHGARDADRRVRRLRPERRAGRLAARDRQQHRPRCTTCRWRRGVDPVRPVRRLAGARGAAGARRAGRSPGGRGRCAIRRADRS